MTAIETLKNMIIQGNITEYDIPVGALRNEAKAKKALAALAPKEEAEDKKAYNLVRDLLSRQSSIWKRYSDVSDGHVGDFLDALAGDKSASDPMPQQWQDELSSISEQLTDELLYTAYPYAVFVRDTDICSFITNKIGYTPIL